jgi:hypothetical protein
VDVIRWRLLPLLLLLACAGKRPAESAAYYDEAETFVAYKKDSGIDFDEAPKPAPAKPQASYDGGDAPAPPPEPPQTEPAVSEKPPVQAEKRMVHYSGYAQLRVTRPDQALDQIVQLAVDSGGKVENLYATAVTIRVPVAKFEEVWLAVRKLGDVLDESVTAEDVTESFLAVDLRVRTLRATRDRLVALLGKAEDEQEKLQLIREIQRVTEQLDQLETQLRTLQGLADLSRITVSLVPREAFTASRSVEDEIAGFRWIRSLSPFRRDVASQGKRLELETGDQLVVLDPKGPFVAESADGAAIWTGRMKNDPVGDATFWATAVHQRLSADFAPEPGGTPGATVGGAPPGKPVGDWQCVRFVDASETAYRWNVCLAVDGKELRVAQAYFPSPAHEERYGAIFEAALQEVEADGVAGGAE